MVRSVYSLVHPRFVHHRVTSQVFIILNLNGIVVFFPVCHEECWIELNSLILQVHLTSYALGCHDARNALISIHNTDVPASLCGNTDNRCDEDVSLSFRLCL